MKASLLNEFVFVWRLIRFFPNISQTLHTMQGIHPKVSKMNWWRLSICEDTLDEVMKVKYYTVIVDEVADIFNK